MKLEDLAPVMRILRREYEKKRTPVVELIQARTDDPFQVLVATILSSRTLDQTTAQACRKLFHVARSLDDLRRLSRARLSRLIYPVGFYRTKAKLLKQLPAAVARHFNGRIPNTVENLIRLPGVGRKTANLVVTVAFNKPAICVDTHVHRICNRWGLIRTRTPLETEMALRRRLPLKYWREFNVCLVSFGQSVCRPVHPHCGECPLKQYCLPAVAAPQALQAGRRVGVPVRRRTTDHGCRHVGRFLEGRLPRRPAGV
ncbi:MAG: endonuclease III [Lentisphaerae bacterium]|nr:endonuclease III [Lentisphaerota bacterium]